MGEKMIAENVDDKDLWERTTLHRAASSNEIEVARAVLEAGVNIDATDYYGTALHHAVLYGLLEIGKFLIDAGADLKIKTRHKHTTMQIAERYNRRAFVEMLRKAMKNQNSSAHRLQTVYIDSRSVPI